MLAVAFVSLALLFTGERLVQRHLLRRWGGGAHTRVCPAQQKKGRKAQDLNGMSAADVSILVTEVSARLKAGAPVEGAWRSAWSRVCASDFSGLSPDGAPRDVTALADSSCFQNGLKAKGVSGKSLGAVVRDVVPARASRVRAVRRAAEDLSVACRLSARIGAPLASILDAIAEGLEEAEAQEEARKIATQGARTSARVLQALPLLGIVVAQVMGAHPVQRFLDGGFGTVMALMGVLFLIAAKIVSETLIARATRAQEVLDDAMGCDLARAALDSGASIPDVLIALGEASGDEGVAAAGRALRLGASWRLAWESRGWELLASGLESAWEEGCAPEALLRRLAAQHRARRATEARTRAQALGVQLVIPLGALLLPAFLLLGVGPVFLHLIESGFLGFS